MTIESDEPTLETVGAFTVWVDDNFHYQDESERYKLGTFATLEAAIAASKRIVAEYLTSAYKPAMSAKELYESYVAFGDDPWIEGHSPKAFSAWTYAEALAAAMTAAAQSA